MHYANDAVKAVFDADNGGFPTQIYVKHSQGQVAALSAGGMRLQIELADGRVAAPYLPENFPVTKSAIEGAERIQFDNIPFRDQSGRAVDDFRLSLRYEFWDDGTVFVRTYFTVDAFFNRPGIGGFKLTCPMDFSRFNNVYQPFGMSPNMEPEGRYKAFTDYTYPEIMPSFNFMCAGAEQAGMYYEVFMEDSDTLSGDNADAATTLSWQDKSPCICWNFQKCSKAALRDRPWEWRTQWGWLFSAPPARRRLPPMRMYHLLDYFEYRVPTLAQLDAMAAAGADAVILHEIWRLDIVSNNFPYAPERLREFIAAAHARDIRVVLYIRGHGDTGAMEEWCDWFRIYLKKDYDGLYMDSGGARNGRYARHRCDGKYFFRIHYLKMRAIRKEIGPYGLLFAHSGCLTSAVGLTPNLIDGYVAGEGESGALTQSRFAHECLSGSYVTTGTMWTAAFPHYSGSRMLPYMAATGQYPHAPLGVQFKSSSLSHPPFPGINDVYLRPLWKLWSTFHGRTDLIFWNNFNNRGVFEPANADTGAYLLIAPAGRFALLILANFAATKQKLETRVNWNAAGFNPAGLAMHLLAPTAAGPGTPRAWPDGGRFAVEVESGGCAGFIIGAPQSLPAVLEKYSRPYYTPPPSLLGRHAQLVEEQQRLRRAPAASCKALYLKAEVMEPPKTLVCARAFYHVAHEIGTIGRDGTFTRLGYISRKGFVKQPPQEEDVIWAGDSSPWVALHEILPAGGRQRVGIKSYSLHIKAYFHSLIEAVISPRPAADAAGAYRLVFLNEVEPQREILQFEVNLSKK